MRVRAYDPSIGRFLSRDPLGRAPLFFADNPYVYAGNNPLSNVDPSGQRAAGASAAQVKQAAKKQASKARVVARQGDPARGKPSLYDRVLSVCGRLSGICSTLIDKLGGSRIITADFVRNLGVALMIIGGVIDLADGLYILSSAADKGKVIGVILAILSTVDGILGDLSNSSMSRAQVSIVMIIGAAVNALAAILQQAAAVLAAWGLAGRVVVDASLTAGVAATEGEAAPIMGILSWLGSNWITYVIGGLGAVFASFGQTLVSLADK